LRAEIFDSATGEFSYTPPMTIFRSGHAAVPLSDGRILIVGGITLDPTTVSGGAATATAEIYDPATGQFTATGSMAQPRYGLTATQVGRSEEHTSELQPL